MPKEYHFTDTGAYHRWLAYGHIHGVMSGNGRNKIFIKGKSHKVMHN